VTGKRGPVSGTKYGQKTGPKTEPKRSTKALEAVPSITTLVPPVPDHLGPVGAAIWRDLWPALPVLSPRIDHSSVLRYCQVSEDAARARAAVQEHGLVIDEIVGDARGGSLGTRLALNPAEAALRRCDRVLLELARDLGLTPASRARLGLTISLGALAAAEAGRVLGTMYAPSPVDIEADEP
jgi:P27 family predicted phage terminase small subunit